MSEILKVGENFKDGVEVDYRKLSKEELDLMQEQFLSLYNDAEHVLLAVSKEQERREKNVSWE